MNVTLTYDRRCLSVPLPLPSPALPLSRSLLSPLSPLPHSPSTVNLITARCQGLELRGSAMDRERLLQECALLPRPGAQGLRAHWNNTHRLYFYRCTNTMGNNTDNRNKHENNCQGFRVSGLWHQRPGCKRILVMHETIQRKHAHTHTHTHTHAHPHPLTPTPTPEVA